MKQTRAVTVVWFLILIIWLSGLVVGCGKSNRNMGGKRRFVNSVCPIHMDNEIEPDKVPMHRIREFKNRKIAFCGDECTPIWDKLSESKKQATLIEAGTR